MLRQSMKMTVLSSWKRVEVAFLHTKVERQLNSHVVFKYSCNVGNAMLSLSAAVFSLNLEFLVFN